MLTQNEIDDLTTYLCKIFNTQDISVLQHPEIDEQALVAMGQEFFARIERDEDEGELSYSFTKDVPDQPHDKLEAHFKAISIPPL